MLRPEERDGKNYSGPVMRSGSDIRNREGAEFGDCSDKRNQSDTLSRVSGSNRNHVPVLYQQRRDRFGICLSLVDRQNTVQCMHIVDDEKQFYCKHIVSSVDCL